MAIGVAVVALVVAALVSGRVKGRDRHVHVEPQVTFALPPAASGCNGRQHCPAPAEGAVTVSVVAGQVAETVNVCIGDQGPFPFILDTGAGQSTIDVGLAHRLHLASAGAASEFAGVGCTGTARPVSVDAWSLDGVPCRRSSSPPPRCPRWAARVSRSACWVPTCFPLRRMRIDFGPGADPAGAEGAPLTQSSPFTGPSGRRPAPP